MGPLSPSWKPPTSCLGESCLQAGDAHELALGWDGGTPFEHTGGGGAQQRDHTVLVSFLNLSSEPTALLLIFGGVCILALVQEMSGPEPSLSGGRPGWAWPL